MAEAGDEEALARPTCGFPGLARLTMCFGQTRAGLLHDPVGAELRQECCGRPYGHQRIDHDPVRISILLVAGFQSGQIHR